MTQFDILRSAYASMRESIHTRADYFKEIEKWFQHFLAEHGLGCNVRKTYYVEEESCDGKYIKVYNKYMFKAFKSSIKISIFSAYNGVLPDWHELVNSVLEITNDGLKVIARGMPDVYEITDYTEVDAKRDDYFVSEINAIMSEVLLYFNSNAHDWVIATRKNPNATYDVLKDGGKNLITMFMKNIKVDTIQQFKQNCTYSFKLHDHSVIPFSVGDTGESAIYFIGARQNDDKGSIIQADINVNRQSIIENISLPNMLMNISDNKVPLGYVLRSKDVNNPSYRIETPFHRVLISTFGENKNPFISIYNARVSYKMEEYERLKIASEKIQQLCEKVENKLDEISELCILMLNNSIEAKKYKIYETNCNHLFYIKQALNKQLIPSDKNIILQALLSNDQTIYENVANILRGTDV